MQKRTSVISNAFKMYSLIRKKYKNTAILESLGEPDSNTNKFTIIGVLADQSLSSDNNKTTLTDLKSGTQSSVDWLNILDGWCGNLGNGDSPYELGAIGYIGYEAGQRFESFKSNALKQSAVPIIYMVHYKLMYVFDHYTKKGTWIWHSKDDSECTSIIEFFESCEFYEGSEDDNTFIALGDVEKDFTKKDYLKSINRCIQYIKDGDILQANITMRFSGKYIGSPFGLYCDLREVTPNPYFAYMDFPNPIISTSPEGFLAINKGIITSRPIKGTVRCSIDGIDQGDNLINSVKDKAENTMIADLIRNDIGRVCKIGSVNVPVLCGLKRFNNLYHLETVVQGEIENETLLSDVLRWNFPGGSITGAPKVHSMEIIDELEFTERGPYSGIIGFFGNNGYINTCIGIRIVYFTSDTYMLHAGGGIVAKSDPENEYEEMILKAEKIISVIQDHNILKMLRAKIDLINMRMLRDISERIKCVNEIGLLKAKYGIPEKQENRIEEIIQQAIAQNKKENLCLPEEVIRHFFEYIIDISMEIERRIKEDEMGDDT